MKFLTCLAVMTCRSAPSKFRHPRINVPGIAVATIHFNGAGLLVEPKRYQ
jgi:hypothetical protein